jgi:hypothetical protein
MPRPTGRGVDFSALSQAVDPDWISRALSVTGNASIRKRKLPADQVVCLVIALALYRHQSIPDVVAHLDLTMPDAVNPEIARSALTQARQRLGSESSGAIVRDERRVLGREPPSGAPLARPVPICSGRQRLAHQ